MGALRILIFAMAAGVAAAGCFHGLRPRSVAACQGVGRPRYFAQADLDRRFGEDLCVMGEDPLASPPADEAYRFLWLRSFHNPVVVRVEQSHGEAVLTAVELSGPIGQGDGSVVRYERRQLGADDWVALAGTIKAAGFWTLPPAGGESGEDGADWVLEGKRGGEQHVVARWDPKPDFRAVCQAFLAAARFTYAADEVY